MVTCLVCPSLSRASPNGSQPSWRRSSPRRRRRTLAAAARWRPRRRGGRGRNRDPDLGSLVAMNSLENRDDGWRRRGTEIDGPSLAKRRDRPAQPVRPRGAGSGSMSLEVTIAIRRSSRVAQERRLRTFFWSSAKKSPWPRCHPRHRPGHGSDHEVVAQRTDELPASP